MTSAQRKTLERIAQQRGKGETISDVLRELISTAQDLEGRPYSKFGEEIKGILEQLCSETNRSVDNVVADCIVGIWGLVEREQAPLIVEEVKLRRKYQKEVHGSRQDRKHLTSAKPS